MTPYRLNIYTPDGLVSHRFSNAREASKAFVAAKRNHPACNIDLHDTSIMGGLLNSWKGHPQIRASGARPTGSKPDEAPPNRVNGSVGRDDVGGAT